MAKWSLAPGSSSSLILTTVLTLMLLAASSEAARANGGTVQVSNHLSGPYQLSVFTSPNPIRVGMLDVSVLVQRPGSDRVVEDAVVMVEVEEIAEEGSPSSLPTFYEATREQATNKLYYATNVDLPREGSWSIEVVALGDGGEATATFQVEATRQTLLEKPMVLAAMILGPIVLVLGWILLAPRLKRFGRKDGGGQE